MRAPASIPRRPHRLPSWLIAVLLIAGGCAASEQEKAQDDEGREDVADVAPAATRATKVAPGPSARPEPAEPGPAPAAPAAIPAHLDRASLRVLGMT